MKKIHFIRFFIWTLFFQFPLVAKSQTFSEVAAVKKITNYLVKGNYKNALDEIQLLIDTTNNAQLYEFGIINKMNCLIELNYSTNLIDTIRVYSRNIAYIKGSTFKGSYTNAQVYGVFAKYYTSVEINYDSAFYYTNEMIKIYRDNKRIRNYQFYGDLGYYLFRKNLSDTSKNLNYTVGIGIDLINKNRKYLTGPFIEGEESNSNSDKSYISTISWYFRKILSFGVYEEWSTFYSLDYRNIFKQWLNLLETNPTYYQGYFDYYNLLENIEFKKIALHEKVNNQYLIECMKKTIFYGERVVRPTEVHRIQILNKKLELSQLLGEQQLVLKSIEDHILELNKLLKIKNQDSFSTAFNYFILQTPIYTIENKFIENHLYKNESPKKLIHLYFDLLIKISKRCNKYEVFQLLGQFEYALNTINIYLRKNINNLNQKSLFAEEIIDLKKLTNQINLLRREIEYSGVDKIRLRKILGELCCIKATFFNANLIRLDKYKVENLLDETHEVVEQLLNSQSIDEMGIDELQDLSYIIFTFEIDKKWNKNLDIKAKSYLDSSIYIFRKTLFDLYLKKINKAYEQLSGVTFDLTQKNIWKPSIIWSIRNSFSAPNFFNSTIMGKETSDYMRSVFVDLLLATANMQTTTAKRILMQSRDEFEDYINGVTEKKIKPNKITYEGIKKPLVNSSLIEAVSKNLPDSECCLLPVFINNQIRFFVLSGGLTFELKGLPINEIQKIKSSEFIKSDTTIGYNIDFLSNYFKTIHVLPLDEISIMLNYKAGYIYYIKKGFSNLKIHTYRDPVALIHNLMMKRKSVNSKFNNAIFTGNIDYGKSNKFSFMSDDFSKSQRGLLTTSNSTFWSNLPGTKQEIYSSSIFFPKTKVFQGSSVDSDKLINSTTKWDNYIFHIATHGYFIDGNDHPYLRSGLVLSNANSDSTAYLTGKDVVKWDLTNCDLFVLSACQSALGDYTSSYSNMGILDAISIAGAKYIIGSLWNIPDHETQEFFVHFYKVLSEVKNIEIAFDKTQKYMSQKYSPYYWAAFCLYKN